MMLALASLTSSYGQIWQQSSLWHDPFDIYAGPVLGGIASNLTEYDGKTMVSPYIGGFIQTYFNNHFGMSLEFAYTRQGSRDAWANFLSDEELAVYDAEGNKVGSRARGPYEYRLDYINTIYKVRYYPIRYFDIFAGVLTGVHFNAKCELDGKSTDIIDQIHKRSAHVIGGVGYELNNLQFEAYYGYPLNKLAKTKKGRQALGSAKEHLILLTIGYRIKIY